MAWDAGTITSATPWAALSQKVKDLISGGSGVANWSFVENIPAGTGVGQSGSASYSCDVFRCRGVTNLYERIIQKNLALVGSTTDGTSFPLAVTTPATNKFITVCVINTKASAADDPTSVTLDGANAPTFTKIKSQASGGASTIVKMTLWIAKTGGSAPTGTTLTVAYGSTQTGCAIIMDEWDGVDVTLGATGVDATGAAQIGIQVVGNNGTNQTAHSATLAAALRSNNIAVTWAAETASTGTYTSGIEANGWVALAGDLTYSTPVIHTRGMWRPDMEDLTGVLTNSSAASMTDWAAIAFEFQRKLNTGSLSNANDAASDFYFVIEIPAADGAVTSTMTAYEEYDSKMFRRPCAAQATGTPVGSGYWRDNVLDKYASVTGSNRGNCGHQALNTSGFNYWIKLTNNLLMISTRVGAAEAMNCVMLLDSFVVNTTDVPLMCGAAQSTAAWSYSRLPGVITATTNAWIASNYLWTQAAAEGFTSNAAGAQDLWANQKVHVGRLFSAHTPGRSAALSTTAGYARGLWKVDFLGLRTGGTVAIGDRMAIGTAVLTSGTLTVGKTYRINTYVAGDDFTNVGGTNASGNVFVATGTTPTTWSNGSSLQELNWIVMSASTSNAIGGGGSVTTIILTKDT